MGIVPINGFIGFFIGENGYMNVLRLFSQKFLINGLYSVFLHHFHQLIIFVTQIVSKKLWVYQTLPRLS